MDPNPVADDFLRQVERRPWLDNVARPILLAVIVASFNLALVNFVRAVNPQWHGAYFMAGMILVTVEAIYSSRILAIYRSKRYQSAFHFRLAEWGILFVVLKALSYTGKSFNAISADALAIAQNPLKLFSADFIAFLLLAVLIWLAVTATMKDFEDLYDPYLYRQASLDPFNNLATRYFWGGGILIVLSGVTRWIALSGAGSLFNFSRPSLGGIILNVLLYFALGLVLLSQAQLTTLFTRWEIQRVNVSSGLARRWVKYGLAVLALVSAAVFLLPTGYTLGFLNSVGLVIEFIIGAIFFVLQFITLFFSLIFYLMARLFGAEETPLPPPTPPPPTPVADLPPPTGPIVSPIPWLEVVRSFIFWLVALSIFIYFVRIYLKDHPELLDWLKRFRLFRLSFAWLGNLWRWLAGNVQAGIDLLPKRVKQAGKQNASVPRPRWRWPRPGKMSPRERILYYYLNTLQRAEQAGAPRQKHQTPTEFGETLKQTIPTLEAESDLLTEAFIRARYSRHTFDAEHASLVKVVWQQIRSALREAARR